MLLVSIVLYGINEPKNSALYTYKYMSSLEQQMGEFIRTFILQLTF